MSNRQPGPVREHEDSPIDAGTLALGTTPKPGTLGLTAKGPVSGPVRKRTKAELAKIKRIAGIVYNETSGVYPALLANKAAAMANWDSKSSALLHTARVAIAKVAYRGKYSVAPSVVPNPKKLTPPGKAQWEDCEAAADEAFGSKSDDHFVIWPSDDGLSPAPKPALQEKWPYDEAGKIARRYGPFRVPAKVGDVPAGSNIYLFFYVGVK